LGGYKRFFFFFSFVNFSTFLFLLYSSSASLLVLLDKGISTAMYTKYTRGGWGGLQATSTTFVVAHSHPSHLRGGSSPTWVATNASSFFFFFFFYKKNNN
jgi:hypothetical protein